jgi:hypothetical protein
MQHQLESICKLPVYLVDVPLGGMPGAPTVPKAGVLAADLAAVVPGAVFALNPAHPDQHVTS